MNILGALFAILMVLCLAALMVAGTVWCVAKILQAIRPKERKVDPADPFGYRFYTPKH